MFARMRRLLPLGASVAVLVAVVFAGTPAYAATSMLVMPDPVLVGTLSLVQGPIITEQSPGDIGRGTVTFRLSAGFAWAFPGGEIPNVSVVDSGRCRGWNALRLGTHNVQSMTLHPDGRDLTVVIGRSSRRGCRGELRFTGFQVHALHTGTGTVTYAGSATIAGLPAGTVLAQVRTPAGPVGVGWGANQYAQAGWAFGYGSSYLYPVQLEDPAVPGVALGAADETSYAVQADGSVKGWGRYADGSHFSDTPVAVTGVTGAVAVTGGVAHSLALRGDGSVLAWGSQDHGQIGNGVFDPTYQLGFAPPTAVKGVTGAVAVEAADRTSYAVRANGTVLAWGDGELGQLGNGTRQSVATPVPVSGLSGVVSLSARSSLVVAATADGSVWQWGWDGYTFRPDGSAAIDVVPRRVAGLPPTTQVAAASTHALALAVDGTVWAWGDNASGCLGDGTTEPQAAPVQVVGLAGIVRIAAEGEANYAGSEANYAVGRGGTLYEWCTPSTDPRVYPAPVTVPTPVWGINRVRDIVTGTAHALAVVK
jgi:alpha-tubulin suppressor-like RCC1 family protein